MRLLGNRAEGHGAGGEALDDLDGRLDFFERDRLVRRFDVQQAAQGGKLALLLVDEVGVFLEGLRALLPHGVLQLARWSADCRDDIRRARGTGSCRRWTVPARTRVMGWKAWRWRAMASSASTSRPTPSMRDTVPVKYLSTSELVQPDGLEDLRAAIALQRRNAHLRKGF